MAEEEQTFDYNDGSGKVPPASRRKVSWTASEFIDHNQGASWYLSLLGLSVVIAAADYFITKEIFSTIIIVALGVIVALAARRKPQLANYEVSSEGLKINQKFYDYGQFRAFSVMHENQLDSLVFDPLKRFMPPISIFFDAADEARIIAIVGEQLPLQDKRPDRIDTISRRLRF